MDLYTTCYNISQIAIFDWTLSTSDHTTLSLLYSTLSSQVKVTLRLAVYSQSVRLGVRPLETHDQRCFPTELLR
jgi:hypothetical protein